MRRPAWRITLPAWRRPMVMWRSALPVWRRWFPAWRRVLPFVGPLLVGALGYLLLGTGPRSNAVRNPVPAQWALPADPAFDLPAADALWAQRAPWGAAANAAAQQEAPAPVLVGVIVERGLYEALFAVAGAPLHRARVGDPLPGGGLVTSITRTRVSWNDAAGRPHERELLAAPREPQTPPAGGA